MSVRYEPLTYKSVLPDQFESDLISYHRRVTVGDVSERPGVYQYGLTLQRLHQVWLDSVLHEYSQSTCYTLSEERFHVSY